MRHHGAILVALILGTAASGCTTDLSHYDPPTQLCHVKVSQESISPLLPPGTDVEVVDETISDDFFICDVSVDGSRVLHIDVFRDRARFDPMKEGSALYSYTDLQEVPFDGRAAVANEGATASVTCHRQGNKPHLNFDIVLHPAEEEGFDVSRDAIEVFLREFVTATKDQERCTE
ncbi:hypothetical protein GCM10009716_29840 [Streptomyces sodiiphilus]|uniref:DUF3558 domain-containing protein n=1 Tax=Streptomyces sodiiphilus TaxID=226217 RepID=A0ABN2PGY7_9ACTN